MTNATGNWPEFFAIMTMHDPRRRGCMPLKFVTQLDDDQINRLAAGLVMMPLPPERGAGLSREAEEWRKECST